MNPNKKKNNDFLHIVKASITNFKNISYREVDFGGRSAIIAGPNQAGKSSLIQAICSPVNSKMTPLEPIKTGEERAKIELQLGGIVDGEETIYNITSYFSPENQKGRLVIEDEFGGKVPGGVKMLESIVGDIGFDIMEFTRMARTDTGKISKEGVRRQIEVLKSLLSKDDLRKLHALDVEYQQKYDERTDINREATRIESVIKRTVFTQEEIEKYSTELSAEEVSAELNKAIEHNNNFDRVVEGVRRYKQGVSDKQLEIDQIDAEIERLTAKKTEILPQLKMSQDKVKEGEDWLLKPEKKRLDLESIQNKFNDISSHNQKYEKIKEIEQMDVTLKAEKYKSDVITERLAGIQKEKKDVFSNSSLPIKGLEFDDEKITYKGLPLDSDQIPTSQLIGIGIKIGMAYAPNLRLLVIRDGSLLDKKTLDLILKICSEENYQILIEMVKFEGQEMSIDFIEKQ